MGAGGYRLALDYALRAAAELVRLAIGLVDLGNSLQVRQLQATTAWSLANLAMFGLFWWGHLREARRWTA